jgi:hypothetical protein
MDREEAVKKLRIEEVFAMSTGSVSYFKHITGGIYTEGVQAVAEIAGAYWLIDAIFSYARKEEIQFWTLEVKASKAVLTMKEDSDRPEIVRQEIEFTDFPEGTWKFYVAMQEGKPVLMVPNEY